MKSPKDASAAKTRGARVWTHVTPEAEAVPWRRSPEFAAERPASLPEDRERVGRVEGAARRPRAEGGVRVAVGDEVVPRGSRDDRIAEGGGARRDRRVARLGRGGSPRARVLRVPALQVSTDATQAVAEIHRDAGRVALHEQGEGRRRLARRGEH